MRTLFTQFVSGAICMAYLVAALSFLQFWRRTHDRLFVLFCIAFLTLAAERIVLLVYNPYNEIVPLIYLVRLAAFLLIIIAVVDKNRR